MKKFSPTQINRKKFKEKFIKAILFICAIFAVIAIFSIIFFLVNAGFSIFQQVSLFEFLTGNNWKPEAGLYGETPYYGTLPLIVGTLLVTIGAMLIAIPLSIGSAIFISELAHPKVKAIAKPAIELLAGIPSVVYGFFGLIILTTWLRVTFDVPTGESMLAGSILLGIMAIPTITSIAEDAISSVPRHFKEGSLAIGATRWQTISKVILPYAMPGITAAIILGTGKVIGETMAVMMVTGNTAIIPEPLFNVFSTVRTLTGTIAIELGETPMGSDWQHALFGLGIILMAITLIINLIAHFVLGKIKEKQMGSSKKKRTQSLIPSLRQVFTENLNKIKKYIYYSFILIIPLSLFYFTKSISITTIIIAAVVCIYFINRWISAKNAERAAFSFVTLSVLIIMFVLGVILWYIISNGMGAITWEFLTEPPKDLGRAGGIFPAIIGTFYLITGAILIALPIGVCAAIYLTEYTKSGKLTTIIRSAVELLNGTPSIVFGLFAFAFLVLFVGLGVSMITGQIILGLMILPIIIRTTEEALRTIPMSMREGSLALGATKWQTIKNIVLPPAVPGIVTGAILGIGMVAGETAPIMFTAVVFSQRHAPAPTDIFEPVMALPYHLFALATAVPNSEAAQSGTALVLLAIVIGFYLIAILIRNYYKKSMKW
ncbi:MAG: phosphate ABC transporter permease [Candidatus Altiarchaeales archaeon WOR_SM1_79]|nr:MAG: phosphate ABC transporter permease [Candidatus Altiarchaeales archaeon WOR_SM1_79]